MKGFDVVLKLLYLFCALFWSMVILMYVLDMGILPIEFFGVLGIASSVISFILLAINENEKEKR